MNRTFLYPALGLLLACQLSHAQGIKIMPGTTFKLTGGTYNLVLAGGASLENNAAVQGNSLVLKATGTGASELKGSGALNIRQLQVNKAAGQNILLQKNISVSEGVYFTTGLLNLNGYDLILADTALLVSESETSRISGTAGAVQITQNLNSPLAENPGNLGLIITSGADWGNTVVRRSPAAYTNIIGGSSIRRSYQVTPTNNTGLNAFLRMYYLDAELNSLNEGTLDFFQSANSGLQWTDIGAASRNTTQNFVNINGVQVMSLFTLSTINNPLPLHLTEINIACLHNRVQLQWRCESVDEGAYFRIMKSKDAVNWESTGNQVMAEPSVYNYAYTDITEPFPYYQLQYVMPDGSVTYTPVQQANCQEEGYVFKLLQNPVNNAVPVSVQAKSALDIVMTIYDQQGRLLLRKDEAIAAGASRMDIDVSGLSKGMYLLQVRNRQEVLWQAKFVK